MGLYPGGAWLWQPQLYYFHLSDQERKNGLSYYRLSWRIYRKSWQWPDQTKNASSHNHDGCRSCRYDRGLSKLASFLPYSNPDIIRPGPTRGPFCPGLQCLPPVYSAMPRYCSCDLRMLTTPSTSQPAGRRKRWEKEAIVGFKDTLRRYACQFHSLLPVKIESLGHS